MLWWCAVRAVVGTRVQTGNPFPPLCVCAICVCVCVCVWSIMKTSPLFLRLHRYYHCVCSPCPPTAIKQVPLVGFIGRLDYQKGADIILQAAPWMIEQGVQLVCLGTGDPALEVPR